MVALGGGDALAGLSTAAANEWLLGQVDAYVRAQDPPLSDAESDLARPSSLVLW